MKNTQCLSNYYLFLASLVNMYKELESDIPGFQRPKHGHLVGWAKQGRQTNSEFVLWLWNLLSPLSF